MTEKLKGGELSQSESASKITVGGQTVEEWVAIKEARELGEELVPDNVIPYRKVRLKHKETTESSSFGRILTRREINEEQWEKIMEKQKTIEGVIIAALLSGREMSGTQLKDLVLKELPAKIQKDYQSRASYIFRKTDFGKFIVDRPEGSGKAFKLIPAALDCTVEELTSFLYLDNKRMAIRKKVLEKHQGLQPYLGPHDPPTKGKKIIEEWEEKPGVGPESGPEEESKAPKLKKLEDFEVAAKNAIQSTIPNPFGVNVFITGKVEIVFRWDKN
jgi:hypothetical protein